MRLLPALTLAVSSSLLFAACSTPIKEEVAKKTDDAPKMEKKEVIQSNGGTVAAVDPLTVGELAKRSVYFDFNEFVVKDEYKNLVVAHSNFLANNKSRHITIQGNTDERGTTEYNLALGAKRAEAVRKAMTTLGANDGQIEAVSLGKEKPKAMGHDEASWQENRRADIVY